MQQNDNQTKNLTNKNKSARKNKTEDINDWRNEHGHPSFEYLQSLKNDHHQNSLEKLRSIAEDLDVQFDVEFSKEELVQKIRSAMQNDSRTTT